ncbi:MAG: metallophosphoesterase [Lachnospiraceae bacterium]|nr:metallophosphoesterase [Lachnospiraceae bacterium]
MRYYISDLHFYHANMNTQMDQRGFASFEEMNEYMIEQWNQKVRKNDEVVILGDFSIAKGEKTNELLQRLKGKKYLIVGNHDRFLNDKTFDRSLFKRIELYMELNDNKRKVILSHYPVFCYNGQYRLNDQGEPKVYMLYGHVHNTYDELLINYFQNITRAQKRLVYHANEERPIPCNMINCFCMFSDYTPLTLDEWIEVDARRRKELRYEL